MKTSKGPACYGCDEKRGIVWQSDSPLLLYLQITPDGLVGLVCVGIRDFAVCQQERLWWFIFMSPYSLSLIRSGEYIGQTACRTGTFITVILRKA